MALVSYSLPNMAGGVSQQPAALRAASAVEELVNGWPSIVAGLQKRQPLEMVAKVSGSVSAGSVGHVINRGAGYQFMLVVSDGELKIVDLFDGSSATVTYPNGKAYLSQSSSPVDDFKFATVGDTTFILNKRVKVRADEYGEAAASGYTPYGTVATKASLPGSSVVDRVYYVTDEDAYYRYESIPASDAVYAWQAAGAWQDNAPPGRTFVGTQLPSPATNAATVYISESYYVDISGNPLEPEIEERIRYRSYDGVQISAGSGAVNGFVLRTLSQIAPPATADRKNPATYGTVYVTQALANSVYAVYVNDVIKATYTTPTGVDAGTAVPSTSAIAGTLSGLLTASGYTNTVVGSTISISNLATADKLTTVGGNGDRALKGYRTSIQQFSDLPPNDVNGRVVKVEGSAETSSEDYYVIHKDGIWIETIGWNKSAGFYDTTMPHTVIREANGTWTFKPFAWADRTVGDENSNPQPTFVGTTINDIYLLSNRLGFLSDENVVLSETDAFENFYRTTVVQLLDTDRIDVAAFTKEVNVLRHAIPFAKNLLVTSDRHQFMLNSGDYLSPKNISLNYVTSFNTSTRVRPVNMGATVYFPDDGFGYTFAKVIEFYTSSDTPDGDGDEVTSPVPEYIPSGLTFLAGSSRMKALVTHSATTPNTLYVYKYFMGGDGRKIQNAWSKWELPDCTRVHHADFVDSFLYVLIQRPDGLFLERTRFDETVYSISTQYTAYLDRKVTKDRLLLTYDAYLDQTTVTMPYQTDGMIEIISNDALTKSYRHTVSKVSSSIFRCDGDLTTKLQVVAGIPYIQYVDLSEQYLRSTKGGETLVLEGRLQLKYLSVETHNTVFFKSIVTVDGRDPETLVHYTDTDVFVPNQPGIDNTIVRIPIMSNARNVKIRLMNDSPFPSAFGHTEFQAEFSPKSTRV